MTPDRPLLLPLGEQSLLIRFSDRLDDDANRAAIVLAKRIAVANIHGVTEIAPNLVSVLVGYDPRRLSFERLAGEIGLLVGAADRAEDGSVKRHRIAVRFGGDGGEDLPEVASALNLSVEEFLARHNRSPLRVLATGFAPGFVYCGLHARELVLPRRQTVRREVPAGSVLFAAGQTAIAATPIPTGWHLIGQTEFRNFQPEADPPTTLSAGDVVMFEALR